MSYKRRKWSERDINSKPVIGNTNKIDNLGPGTEDAANRRDNKIHKSMLRLKYS